MSFVKDEHREVLKAYDLLNNIYDPDLDRPFLETDFDPEDEVTEGFSAVVLINPAIKEYSHYLAYWAETPVEAAQGLIDNLRKEGYIE